MKTNTTKNLLRIIILILVVQLFSCRKEKPPTLPPITQTGANTFGCLVDGKVWVPKGSWAINTPYYFDGYYAKKWFYINMADRIDEPQERFTLMCYPISGDTTIEIKNHSDSLCDYRFSFERSFFDPTSWEIYLPVKQYSGQLTISKLDSINNIISGTFWFDAIDTISGKIIHVTDGRFDIGKY